jgi:hypothetical protein
MVMLRTCHHQRRLLYMFFNVCNVGSEGERRLKEEISLNSYNVQLSVLWMLRLQVSSGEAKR